MKRGYTYTIIFILVVSAVFTLFLAGIDVLMKPKITANARLEEQKSILNAFNVDDEGTAEEINLRFNDLVKADETSEMLFYSHQDSSGHSGSAERFAHGSESSDFRRKHTEDRCGFLQH